MQKIPPNIWALGWVSFFTDLATAMIKPLIPIYVVLVLNQGMDKLGYVLAITAFVSYVFRWGSGYLSDRYQVTKPLLLVGYGLSGIMKPMFAYTASWGGVAVISATERLGKAVRSAPKDVLISASAQSNNQGKAFGVHKTLDIAGETVGGIIAFLLLSWLGQSPEFIRTIFELTIIPGVIGMLILWFFVTDVVKNQEMTMTKNSPDLRGNQRFFSFDPSLWSWFVVYFIAVFFMMSDAFMVVRGSEIGIATHWLPILMVASALTQTLISYRVGKRLDIQGASYLLKIGLLAGVLSMLLLFLQNAIAIIFAFVLQGVFMVSTLNAMRARIGQSKQGKGNAYGVFYLGVAVAGALGSLVIGHLWEHMSAYGALVFSGVGLTLLLLTVSLLKGVLPSPQN